MSKNIKQVIACQKYQTSYMNNAVPQFPKQVEKVYARLKSYEITKIKNLKIVFLPNIPVLVLFCFVLFCLFVLLFVCLFVCLFASVLFISILILVLIMQLDKLRQKTKISNSQVWNLVHHLGIVRCQSL